MLIAELGAMLLVFAAIVPVLAGLYQYSLVGASFFATHLDRCRPTLPRVSIIIPAWNEAAVIGNTIERLLGLSYPKEKLRIYVVDDASTDDTPHIVRRWAKRHPKQVFLLRREKGGQGKAHTLNHGLEQLWKHSWTEAVLITDADVVFTPNSLRQMSRHLADPSIGAVTAYIKEGSAKPNYLQRFIGFEYITATGASRRAQNVLGFLACLSGGAQLHSRENLMAIGGRIFSETLAEDTFTTFRTQLEGRRAIFEANAIVYAEEPDDLNGLWKQRLRWARGNVQVTQVFRQLWFSPGANGNLGSVAMGVLWFSLFLMPVFQIGASVGLLSLFALDASVAWLCFRGFWLIAGIVYLVVTGVSFFVDPESAARSWREGVLFPGIGALLIIAYSFFPLGIEEEAIPDALRILLYLWPVLSMLIAWLAKEASRRWPGPGSTAGALLIYLAGYGPLLSAITFAAYVTELRGAEMKWDKTNKTGKVK